jgi:hypothetical protein
MIRRSIVLEADAVAILRCFSDQLQFPRVVTNSLATFDYVNPTYSDTKSVAMHEIGAALSGGAPDSRDRIYKLFEVAESFELM